MRRTRQAISSLTFALALAASWVVGATAQDSGGVPVPATSGKPAAEAPSAPPTPTIQTSLGPYGDPGGIRAFLDSKGIDYNFTYIGEVLGNATGGIKRGATYEGRLDGQLDVDVEKLANIKGGAIHANFYQIHGRGLGGNNTLDLFTLSGIEAYPSTKLYEAYYEQKLLDGHLFVRAGQLAADTEFFFSETASVFIGSTFGWPAIYANDLPSGGPSYPLATPGARIKLAPADSITLLAAVFDGDPAGPYRPGGNNTLPQIRDLNGTLFRLQDAPLFITEGKFLYNRDKDSVGLPGTFKVGYLHHFGDFASNDLAGRSMRGLDSAYAIIDQTIYRKPGTEDQGAAIFGRASVSPSDRSLIDIYVDAGISYKGLIPGRPDDTVGVAGAYARISPSLSAMDIATGSLLVRDYQASIEATYQYAVLPGLSVQPDFQYVFHPGAHGVADPSNGLPIKDAAIFGLRTTIHY